MLLKLSVLTLGCICSFEARAAGRLYCPDLALVSEAGGPQVSGHEVMPRLRALMEADAAAWSQVEKASCYKELADDYRDSGSYRAELLYLRAVELGPEHPRLLEAIARYYRTFRGSKGLFAESERYYLRAEDAIQAELGALETAEHREVERLGWECELRRLREEIIRGRVELNRGEGVRLQIPKKARQQWGVYFGSQVDVRRIAVLHKYLAGDARKAINRSGLPDANIQDLLRRPKRVGLHGRLRLRYGSLPYLDIGWHRVDVADAIADYTSTGVHTGLKTHELEFAVEDTVGLAPAADALWRLEYRRVTAKEEGKAVAETADRLNAATTVTRSFGRVKADIEFAGSYAWVERRWGSHDSEHMLVAGLRAMHFPRLATTERWTVDPRAQEFKLGYVRERQNYHDSDDADTDGILHEEVVSDTIYAGLKLSELLPRTDVAFLANWFETETTGDPGEDNGSVEFNLIFTYRILDWVNDLRIGHASRPVGLAQWAVHLRPFEEVSTHALRAFESRGAVLSSSLELFSGPANRSTAILEASYEVRDYHRLDDVQHLLNVALRLGL